MLVDTALEPLCQHRCLELLHLSECTFLTDEGIRLLASHLTRLQSLRVTGCDGLTDAGAPNLAALSSLQDLDLSATRVHCSSPLHCEPW